MLENAVVGFQSRYVSNALLTGFFTFRKPLLLKYSLVEAKISQIRLAVKRKLCIPFTSCEVLPFNRAGVVSLGFHFSN